MPYAAGNLYCRTQRCPRLHAQRQRIHEVDDPSGEPCPVHIGDTSDNSLGVPELKENVESGTIEDTEWVRDALTDTNDTGLLRDARTLVSDNSALAAYINDRLIDRGECPWCSEYSGDHVGQHASSAHPEEWQTYTSGE